MPKKTGSAGSPDKKFLEGALAAYNELCTRPHEDVPIAQLAKMLAQKTRLNIEQVYRKLAELNVWERLDGEAVLVQYSQGIFARRTDLVLPNGKRYALVRIEKASR